MSNHQSVIYIIKELRNYQLIKVTNWLQNSNVTFLGEFSNSLEFGSLLKLRVCQREQVGINCLKLECWL